MNSVDIAYSSPAWWYDIRGFFILTFTYNDSLWRQVQFFSKNISIRHLEAAIGSGSLAKLIFYFNHRLKGEKDFQFVGFDYAPKMLNSARKKLRGPNFDLMVADIQQLPFPDNHFSSINLANALHCLPDPQQGLNELYRVSQSGGTLALNALLYPSSGSWMGRLAARINSWGIGKGILKSPLKPEEAVFLVEKAGFKLTESKRVGNALYIRATK